MAAKGTKQKGDREDRERAESAVGSKHLLLTHWWADNVIAEVDHDEVVRAVREDAGWSAHFVFMTLMSAGIAILGLLLSSPAVVIGAMLISPLMGPIIGVGFALATFDSQEIRRNLRAIVLGTVLAVAFCAFIVLASPLQTVTPEIASRTRPNLFDLLVALLSGLAATYAMVRGRHGAIVGVAIATALMPPIAVMGFGLATANWHVLSGSFLLFFTNFMTISASAAVLARLYGFATDLSPQQTRLQATLLFLSLAILAVPLGLALRNIAWEALASREAKSAILDSFDDGAHVSDINIDFDHEPIAVEATVLTPAYSQMAEDQIQRRLRQTLNRMVEVSIDQVRTVDGNGTELAAADKSASLERNASRIERELAALAGVSPDSVLVDRAQKVVRVRAAPLPGATLGTYYALERRFAQSEPGWTIELVPPLLELPNISVPAENSGPDRGLAVAAWAGKRTGVPIVVSGSAERTKAIAAQLRGAGAAATQREGGPNGLRWATDSATLTP